MKEQSFNVTLADCLAVYKGTQTFSFPGVITDLMCICGKYISNIEALMNRREKGENSRIILREIDAEVRSCAEWVDSEELQLNNMIQTRRKQKRNFKELRQGLEFLSEIRTLLADFKDNTKPKNLTINVLSNPENLAQNLAGIMSKEQTKWEELCKDVPVEIKVLVVKGLTGKTFDAAMKLRKTLCNLRRAQDVTMCTRALLEEAKDLIEKVNDMTAAEAALHI
ncbi:MAG: hypothetical protein MJZ34_02515 [Paludibacteraceae bacterium]|nr:hypothetical protein [Paludibacteraceae bacterium]